MQRKFNQVSNFIPSHQSSATVVFHRNSNNYQRPPNLDASNSNLSPISFQHAHAQYSPINPKVNHDVHTNLYNGRIPGEKHSSLVFNNKFQ